MFLSSLNTPGVKGCLAGVQVGDIEVTVTEVNESGALCVLEEGKVNGFVKSRRGFFFETNGKLYSRFQM